uniref:Maelstrom domain-containing protein n=1 Tax=Romanomermis culicivorax TaxID=13658 RepID=A0A915JKN9_ROMCU
MLPDDEEDENFYIPAEICCSEFTIRDGLRQKFCALVKPPESVHSLKTQIDHYGVEHHGYNFAQLCEEGRSCDEIARHLLKMVKNRDMLCGSVKFFVLGSEFHDVLKALDFILRNSTMEECHRTISPGRHLAYLDDLAQSFFKFFGVDYSNAPNLFEKTLSSDDPIDLTAILKSLNIHQDDGRICGSADGCPYHYDPKNPEIWEKAPICVLRRQCLVIEIIKSSIEFRHLDAHHIKSFAENSIDYLSFAQMNVGGTGVRGTSAVETSTHIVKNGVTNQSLSTLNVESDKESIVHSDGVTEIENSTAPLAEVSNFDHNAGSIDDPITAGRILNPLSTEILKKYLSSGEIASSPSFPTYKYEENVVPQYVDDAVSSSTVDDAGSATIIPSTSVVQKFLPLEMRGFGRGLHLTPEGSLLKALRIRHEF